MDGLWSRHRGLKKGGWSFLKSGQRCCIKAKSVLNHLNRFNCLILFAWHDGDTWDCCWSYIIAAAAGGHWNKGAITIVIRVVNRKVDARSGNHWLPLAWIVPGRPWKGVADNVLWRQHIKSRVTLLNWDGPHPWKLRIGSGGSGNVRSPHVGLTYRLCSNKLDSQSAKWGGTNLSIGTNPADIFATHPLSKISTHTVWSVLWTGFGVF